MTEGLFLIEGDMLIPMPSSAPRTEDELQALLARHSDLLGVGDLLLVMREQSIADSDGGSARWSLDHLFVTRDAVPVLVEVKRATDTRLRREVIGQLLDYAANGAAFWRASDLGTSFASTFPDTDAKLASFVGPDVATAGFWERVEGNLRDGRMRLIIVADVIPTELARIVEFLNDQMRVDVFAIELRHFQSADGRLTLAPRVIGQSALVRARKEGPASTPAVDYREWIRAKFGSDDNAAARSASIWARVMSLLSLNFSEAKLGGYLYARKTSGERVFALTGGGKLSIPFNCNLYLPEETRGRFLERFQFLGASSTMNISGEPAFEIGPLDDEHERARFMEIAQDWIDSCRSA